MRGYAHEKWCRDGQGQSSVGLPNKRSQVFTIAARLTVLVFGSVPLLAYVFSPTLASPDRSIDAREFRVTQEIQISLEHPSNVIPEFLFLYIFLPYDDYGLPNASDRIFPTTAPLLPLLSRAPRCRSITTNPTTPSVVQLSHSHSALTHIFRRRQSVGVLANQYTPSVPINPSSRPSHCIRLDSHLDSCLSLKFGPISRDVKEGDVPLRIDPFTDRSGLGIANPPGSNKLASKSKVISCTP